MGHHPNLHGGEQMAKSPKYNAQGIVQKIEMHIDNAIEAMDESQPTITVDLERYKAFERDEITEALEQAYLGAGWAKVEFQTWEGSREDGKSVFKIRLSAI